MSSENSNKKSNVIPFPKTVKLNSNFMGDGYSQNKISNQVRAQDKSNSDVSLEENVIDVTNKLREQGAQDRRKAQRVMFEHLIASYVVIPNSGLVQVQIINIDEGGLAFEMDLYQGVFDKDEAIDMRFYLNGQTYFPLKLNVMYGVTDKAMGVFRAGAQFAQDTLNQEALYYFVQFLKTVAVNLKTDKGDRIVSNLSS